MNVERTIEFILNSQAKAEARMDKTDKEIAAIRKLLHQGMRILVSIENAQKRTEARVAELAQTQNELAQAQKKTEAAMAQSQKRTDTATADLKKSMAELAEAQKETQRSLKAFLDSMRHRRNGA